MENELRRDYFTDRQVIIAVGRGRRPTDFKHEAAMDSGDVKGCFFCPGNESSTPPEIMRVEEGGKWVVRVFPNKFPAVKPERGESTPEMMPAYGYHEIVVETPDHTKTVADLSVEEIGRVLKIYTARVDAMYKDPIVKYALVFKNHGKAAGASLAHTHTQIVSLPIIPKAVAEEEAAAAKYRMEKGSCPLCDAWKREASGPRGIWEDGNAAVFAPYASRNPFEAWVLPKRHVRVLGELRPDEIASLAQGLKLVLGKLKDGLSDTPYNMHFHLAPPGGDLHMHLEVMPKLSTWAGFELGSGIIINTMPPEKAAEFYRQT